MSISRRQDWRSHRSRRQPEGAGLELVPGRKIGVGLERQQMPTLPLRIASEAERSAIAYRERRAILADPALLSSAQRTTQATFTDHDLAKFLHTRTEGSEQFRAAQLKVSTSRTRDARRDDRGRLRYTSREMPRSEEGMLHRRNHDPAPAHGVTDSRARAVVSQPPLK